MLTLCWPYAGLDHAASDHNDDGQVNDEYGDVSCIMGIFPSWRSFNAPHRVELGWVLPKLVTHLTPNMDGPKCLKDTPMRTQVVRIAPLHVAGGAVVAGAVSVVTLPRPQARNPGTYYVSYRRSVGYDAKMPEYLAGKVHVHYSNNLDVSDNSMKSSRFITELGSQSTWASQVANEFAVTVDALDVDAATVSFTLCGSALPTAPPAGEVGKCDGVKSSGRVGR